MPGVPVTDLTDVRNWRIKARPKSRRIEATCDDVRVEFVTQPYGNLASRINEAAFSHQPAYSLRGIVSVASRAVSGQTGRRSFWPASGAVILFEADGAEGGREIPVDHAGFPSGFGPAEALGNATRMALSRVSTSVSEPIGAAALQVALQDPSAPGQPYVRRLLEEASQQLLAGLVLEGFTTWAVLVEAADRYPPADDETTSWLRDMARLALV
jgi:hypothetical protein